MCIIGVIISCLILHLVLLGTQETKSPRVGQLVSSTNRKKLVGQLVTLAAINLHFLFITSFLRLMRDCGDGNSSVQ